LPIVENVIILSLQLTLSAMSRRKTAIFEFLYGGPTPQEIGDVVATLNGTGEESDELRALIIRWKASRRNLREMLFADRALLYDLQGRIGGEWMPSFGPRAVLVPMLRDRVDITDTPVNRARSRFASFVLNPDCEMLGGPCEIGTCGIWFHQKTRHWNRFCSRKCASIANGPAATRTTKANRKEAHKRRINWAGELITNWSSKPRREEWKPWVIGRLNDQERIWAEQNRQPEPDPLTVKWLTRWVTKGELQDPSPKRERKRK
jgi:hypothetical protein